MLHDAVSRSLFFSNPSATPQPLKKQARQEVGETIDAGVLRYAEDRVFSTTPHCAAYWAAEWVPVIEYSTHSAILVAWSPILSRYLAIIKRSM